MILKKALNNNVILTENISGDEVILIGTGIGFKKKAGDTIDEDKISKRFESNNNPEFADLLSNLPIEIIELASEMAERGKQRLTEKISDAIILHLSDHLHYAIIRANEQVPSELLLHWEIPHLYPEEYQLGLETIELVKEKLDVTLPPIEASMIAMHFVTSQTKLQEMNKTMQVTKIMKEIVQVVQYHFHQNLDEKSEYYNRFIIHLRYFILRIINQEELVQNTSDVNFFLLETLKAQYPESFHCVRKIEQLILKNYQWKISTDELTYLIIHIARVIG